MTLAPRVQVYTQLPCNAIYGHDVSDHTTTTDGRIEQLSHIPFYSSLDPTGPHIDNQLLHSLESNYPVFQTFSNSSNTEDNDDDDLDVDEDGMDEDDEEEAKAPVLTKEILGRWQKALLEVS